MVALRTMPSAYGKRRGDPDYDRFRTGFTYDDVLSMLWSEDPDPKKWRYRRRGTVLGFWHQMKKEMYEEATRMPPNHAQISFSEEAPF